MSPLHIHNLTMDPPPKKCHLTQQFLTEVTRKEGLRWEANLAAHVSDSFFTFHYLSKLPVTSHVLEKATRWSSFKSITLSKNTSQYQVISGHFIFLSPLRTFPQGSCAWMPYRNFESRNWILYLIRWVWIPNYSHLAMMDVADHLTHSTVLYFFFVFSLCLTLAVVNGI